jgi:hypothetical protein
MRINRNRTRHDDQEDFDVERVPANRTISPGGEPLEAAAGRVPDDDIDGQLGPDELPDPDEVAMNLESKRHH